MYSSGTDGLCALIPDGDLTHEEVLQRKRKIATKLKVLTAIRHRNEGIGQKAGSHLIPEAATPFARVIHEFNCKLMGVPCKARGSSNLASAGLKKLPDPPSNKERNNWLNQRQA
ncbi:uncharacterized protein MELLADRAFT_105504 [Melampsora larici-populina 98AG31]|uniref:Uncharacterized protein n=1 Tax=Melampsora larici-populina (strain 98AG31 / pathotype 3-4-7) TaxID=747676 RepID=F4RIF5_MELLP|nr:uncharacterized protein MELLADRAFT_105504 [Melampsora larici-populina 98AG31]EGG07843.1 hypothetical protein MELLADRAFT_105504 [Melampsora larici-populina 98AG31]